MAKRPDMAPSSFSVPHSRFTPQVIVVSEESDSIDALLEFPAEVVPPSPLPESSVEFPAEVVPPSPVPESSVEPEQVVLPPPPVPPRVAVPPGRTVRSMIWLTAGVAASALAVWMETRSDPAGETLSSSSSPALQQPPSERTVLAGARLVPSMDRIVPPAITPPAARPTRPAAAIERTIARPRSSVPAASRPTPKAAAESTMPAASFHGVLVVDSNPAGARVFVNGQRVGSTPLIVQQMPAGSRVIRIEADGYAVWSSALRVVANQENRIAATLRRQR